MIYFFWLNRCCLIWLKISSFMSKFRSIYVTVLFEWNLPRRQIDVGLGANLQNWVSYYKSLHLTCKTTVNQVSMKCFDDSWSVLSFCMMHGRTVEMITKISFRPKISTLWDTNEIQLHRIKTAFVWIKL